MAFGAGFRLGSLFFPILRRRACFERAEKTSRNAGNILHRSVEQCCIPLRWSVEPADFSYKLNRGSSDLFGSRRRIEIKEGLNVPAHLRLPASFPFFHRKHRRLFEYFVKAHRPILKRFPEVSSINSSHRTHPSPPSERCLQPRPLRSNRSAFGRLERQLHRAGLPFLASHPALLHSLIANNRHRSPFPICHSCSRPA